MGYEDYYRDNKSTENRKEALPAIGSEGTWRNQDGLAIAGRVKSGRVGGPFEIETPQGLVYVNKLYEL